MSNGEMSLTLTLLLMKWVIANIKHLSYFCKFISAEIIYFIHVEVKFNLSDLFNKILGQAEFWPLIHPLLFWKDETIIPDKPLPEIIQELKAKIMKDKRKRSHFHIKGSIRQC
jgi:hypothetical protein